MGIKAIHGKKHFDVTHTHATLASAKQGTPSTSGQRIFVTDIAGSSDKDGAILYVKEGSGTILFQVSLSPGRATGTPFASFAHSFQTPLIATADVHVYVEVDGTEVCKANIVGYIA